jgi:hypothetical protein
MQKRNVCFATLFMLLSATATVSIGYTQLVQGEIKEDLNELKQDIILKTEKINSIQITQAETKGDIKLILHLMQNENFD